MPPKAPNDRTTIALKQKRNTDVLTHEHSNLIVDIKW